MSHWHEPGIGPLAFARDIPLLAVTATGRTVRLVDPSSGRELATLSPPDRHIVTWLCFSPDGSQLAAATQDNIIQLWDLRALRQELAARQLDWDLPPYSPLKDSSVQPIQVRVEPAEDAAWKAANDPARLRFQVGLASFMLALNPFHVEACLQRAEAYARLGELEKARADYRLALALLPPGNQQRLVRLAAAGNEPRDYAQQRNRLEKALEQDPENGRLCNNLAWSYVTGPAHLRAPDKALPLARKAVAREPGPVSRNTLGVVYYRLGRYREAVDCFEQNVKEGHPYVAFDLVFLAMSYFQLDQIAKAEDCYERARQWSRQTRLTAEQAEGLKSFEAEAQVLLKSR
jgi:tetratricopeptide (TPR) repeat protein